MTSPRLRPARMRQAAPLDEGQPRERAGRQAEASDVAPSRGEGAARSELVLFRSVLVIRGAYLALLPVVVGLAFGKYRPAWGAGTIAAAAVVESWLVIRAATRRRAFDDSRLAFAEVAFHGAALVAMGSVLAGRYIVLWPNFMYPLSLTAAAALGIGFRRPLAIGAGATTLAAAYLGSAALGRSGSPVNAVGTSLSFFAISAVAAVIARELRRTGRELDGAKEEAIRQEAEAARAREQARTFRELHDHVLQTLESIAWGSGVIDERLRFQATREAQRLRLLIEGRLADDPHDLVQALSAVVQGQADRGLLVELNAAGMDRPVPPHLVMALAGAVNEALTNVRKHARVSHAVVHASPERRGILVTVVDQGVGFDVGSLEPGMGIKHSLRGRMEEVGGDVRIDSSPHGGTSIELWGPF